MLPYLWGFPGGTVVKSLPANAGDTGDSCLISGSGRSSKVGNGNPLQYSCLENSMDRAWWVESMGSQRAAHDQHVRCIIAGADLLFQNLPVLSVHLAVLGTWKSLFHTSFVVLACWPMSCLYLYPLC